MRTFAFWSGACALVVAAGLLAGVGLKAAVSFFQSLPTIVLF